jgi:hypothetical protein
MGGELQLPSIACPRAHHASPSAGAEPGIYVVTMQAVGGGIIRTFELALVLN